jgi:hypothetical protein
MSVRFMMIVICLMASCGALVMAQADSKEDIKAPTGRSQPEGKGQLQPQGWTGPLNTTTGGAPAESPQGQSPPGMQPAPDGSNKTVVQPSR